MYCPVIMIYISHTYTCTSPVTIHGFGAPLNHKAMYN